MTKKYVIVAENITKVYPRHPQLMKMRDDSLVKFLGRWFTRDQKNLDEYYALKDVSFSVMSGESVAVVGSNGAGKSTLMRVLAGITQPTVGSVEVTGNYGELFALNSGFNNDLSGRKNIFLIGAIKGFSAEEVEKKIDEIIEFSDLGDFIDQPVKVYSSGMRGRLGFSILINFLPDIIFIDEALATGDQSFQKKCIARLNRLVIEGKTLVIVSHADGLLRRICSRAIWLEHGQVLMDGDVNQVIDAYVNASDHDE